MSTKCLPKSKIKNEYFKSHNRCTICKSSFQKFIIFEGHFAFNVICRAKNGCFIQCYVCRQKFRYLAELKYHIRLHSIQNSEQLKPSDCNDRSNRENGNSQFNGLECNICQRSCRTKFYLKEHLLSHSKEAIANKPTTNGGADAKNMDQMPSSTSEVENHKNDLPDKAEEEEDAHRHKCESCNLSFTTEISLKFHRLGHRSGTTDRPKENNLQCEICQARFTYMGNVVRHKFVHTTGDVECKICHIKFTKMSLTLHEREAHLELLNDVPKDKQPDNEITSLPIALEIITPPIVSDSVTPTIESVANIPIASDVVTPSTASEIATLPPTADLLEPVHYNCDQCNEICRSMHHLQLHLKSHRQCSCWICGRTFKNKTGLKCHSRWHRFECYICKRDFSSFKHLARHTRKHQVYERWVDPVDVYLSNWSPEMSREILQNQPLVMVERLNVTDANAYSIVFDKSNGIDATTVKNQPPHVEINTDDVAPIMNGASEVDDFEIKYSEPQSVHVNGTKTQPSNGVHVHQSLSLDDDGIMIVEQQPDTTTDDIAIDISSESDIDEMEMYHCYFCNETFRSLDTLGVHVKKCSHCP